MLEEKILFIGGGNMARAMVSGLLAKGAAADRIYVVDPHPDKRDYFARELKVLVSESISTFVTAADIIILAVKPQSAPEVCKLLAAQLKEHTALIISVMAAVTLAKLENALGEHLAIVRAMPNTPAMIGCGATGLFANSLTTEKQRESVARIMAAIGIFAWLDEEVQLNAITALSGSGPAYYFYFMDMMQSVAVKLGLSPAIAREFAVQTAYGSAKLALTRQEDLALLRHQVTSKKGTTAAALAVMEEHNLASIFAEALQAAYDRALELNRE